MYQEQPCMVVLLGKGRCTKNSPVWWFYWGREDVPARSSMAVLLGREDELSKSPVYWCYKGEKIRYTKPNTIN